MEVVAHLRNLRIAPRKIRLVVDLIRGMNTEDAKIQLSFLNKKSSKPVLKLLNSAIANASHNFSLDKNSLYISKIVVNEGVTLKRWIPRAMGRASAIKKRSSHITLTLKEIDRKNNLEKNTRKDIKKVKNLEKDQEKIVNQNKKSDAKTEKGIQIGNK